MTSAEDLTPGDVVKVRSGGPLMTVRSVNTFKPALRNDLVTEVWCEWFDADLKRHGGGDSEEGHFFASTLEKIE
jgi:uncharacterized protein YodC (DUF2158 family)